MRLWMIAGAGVAVACALVLVVFWASGGLSDVVAGVDVMLPAAPTKQEDIARAARQFQQREQSEGVRGPAFEAYVLTLNEYATALTLSDVFGHLGSPDLYHMRGSDIVYAYPYTRSQPGDSVVYVVTRSGTFLTFGFNDRRSMNDVIWSPYVADGSRNGDIAD